MVKTMAIVAAVDGRYWDYVPLFVYSINLAYPEYMPIIVGRGGIPSDVLKLIECHGLKCLLLGDALLDVVPTAWGMKASRVVINLPVLHEYSAVYITDVDFLIIREPVSIMETHLIDCIEEGLCYSNTFHGEALDRGPRMMGMHFFVTRPYFEKMASTMQEYRLMLETPGGVAELRRAWHNPLLGGADAQFGLYLMLMEARMGLPQNKADPLRPYHGIHLGHARVDGRWEMFVKNQTGFRKMPGPVDYYHQEYIRLRSHPTYQRLFDAAPGLIQDEIRAFDDACL